LTTKEGRVDYYPWPLHAYFWE